MSVTRHASIPGPALFYCRTPLQALIAERMIPRVVGDSVALYHPTSQSPRHRHYFNRLSATEAHFVSFETPRGSDTLTEALTWWRIPESVKQRSFASILVASIGSIPLGMLAARNSAASIFTFDDGTFNLCADVYEPWIAHEPIVRRAVKAVLRGGTNPALMARSVTHFTIFPEEIVVGRHRRIERVDPFTVDGAPEMVSSGRRVRIILGTKFADAAVQARHDRIVHDARFDLFLPHPADSRRARAASWLTKTLNLEEVDHQIAEETIAMLRKQGLQPIVYGFNSTVLYNVAGHTRAFSISLGEARPQVPAEVAKALGVRQLNCSAS